MEENRVDIQLSANEVFDLLPEHYQQLPLAAITDKYFTPEVSLIVASELNARHFENDAHGLLNAAIRYDLDMQAVEKAVKEARKNYEEGEQRRANLYKKIVEKIQSLSELEIQRLLSEEAKNGVEHAIRI